MTDEARQPKRNLMLVIAYRGTAYHGWQRQADGIDTVQQRVETAALAVLRHPLHVHGCSRTDAGVHAEGQVAHIRTPNESIPLVGMRRAMNSRLPGDIVVRSITEVPMDFDASRSAVGKTYLYRIWPGPILLPSLAGLVWRYWRPLDVDRMRAGAMRLVGTHDFRGFAGSLEERQTTVRTIFRCDAAEEPTTGAIGITVRGDGFLYNMVRNIAGTLVEIARGRWEPTQIDRVLATCSRSDAGPTAPPDGLTLQTVHYDPADLHTG